MFMYMSRSYKSQGQGFQRFYIHVLLFLCLQYLTLTVGYLLFMYIYNYNLTY